jgi:hypothetical protein
MKAVFWDVAPCSLLEIGRCIEGAYWLHHQALMTEAAGIPETLANFYQTTRRNIPEDNLHNCRHDNLKRHLL